MNDSEPDAERLNALLHDAVADVEPRPALDDIRARTKVVPMTKRPWILAAVGAVAATAATVTAVAVVTDDDPAATSGPATTSESAEPTPSEEPSDTPEPSESPAESPAESPSVSSETVALPVFYVGDQPAGPRLFREVHEVAADGPAQAAGRTRLALDEAVSGDPLDADYRTDWPAGTSVTGVSLDAPDPGALLWVDLTADSGSLEQRPAGVSPAEAEIAVQQLVYTAQEVLQSPARLGFRVNGTPATSLLGVPTSEPVTAAEPMEVQAPVWVTTPQDGATVDRTFVVEGRGAFFEANVSWQLLRGSEVVKEGFATAEECCTLAPYSFEVTAPPGEYVLRVYDADMSGGEGGTAEPEDTKRIVIQA